MDFTRALGERVNGVYIGDMFVRVGSCRIVRSVRKGEFTKVS